MLEFVRRDALAAIIPALPIPAGRDLRALVVGRLGILVTGDHDGGIEGLGDIERRKSLVD